MASAADVDARPKKSGKADGDELADQVEALRNDLQKLTDTVSRIAKGQVSRAQHVARDQIDRVQERAYETAQEAEDAIRRNPLSAVAIAVGLGFLFGLITRR